MIKKYLLFFTILLSSGLTFAKDCKGDSEYFRHNFKITWITNNAIAIKGSNSQTQTRLRLSTGKEFSGIQDRHGSIIYKLIEISKRKAKFKFRSSFDTRGIGGRLTECKGKFTIDF